MVHEFFLFLKTELLYQCNSSLSLIPTISSYYFFTMITWLAFAYVSVKSTLA